MWISHTGINVERVLHRDVYEDSQELGDLIRSFHQMKAFLPKIQFSLSWVWYRHFVFYSKFNVNLNSRYFKSVSHWCGSTNFSLKRVLFLDFDNWDVSYPLLHGFSRIWATSNLKGPKLEHYIAWYIGLWLNMMSKT